MSPTGSAADEESRLRDRIRAEPLDMDAVGRMAAILLDRARRDGPRAEAAAVEAARLTGLPGEATGLAADLLVHRAETALGTGATGEAEAALRQALGLHPDHPPSRRLLARLLTAGGEMEQRESLALEPDDPVAASCLAITLHNKGARLYRDKRWNEAETAFREAALLAPDLDAPLAALAMACAAQAHLLLDQGRCHEAEALVREGLVSRPEDAWLGSLLDRVLGNRVMEGDTALAPQNGERHAALRELLARHPDDPDLHRTMAQLLTREATDLMQRGAKIAARARLWQAIGLDDTPVARHQLAGLLSVEAAEAHNAGRYAEALNRSRTALRLEPECETAREVIQKALLHTATTAFTAAAEPAKTAALLELIARSGGQAPFEAWIAACLLVRTSTCDEVARMVLTRTKTEDRTDASVIDAISQLCQRNLALPGTVAVLEELFRDTGHGAVCAAAVATQALAEGRPDVARTVLGQEESNWSQHFTAGSIAAFRLTGRADDLVRRPAPPAERRIAISSLSDFGRFGHVVLNYLTLRDYAARHDLVLETPEWVGHYVFELNDPLYADHLPFRRPPMGAMPDGPDLAGTNVFSPANPPTAELVALARASLSLRPRWLPFLQPALDALGRRGRTLVALHLRRGDIELIGQGIAPARIYTEWLEAHLRELDDPVVYVASDCAETKAELARFGAVSLEDVAEPWGRNAYLQDFFVLMNADIVARSTGSFALLAGLLNRRARLLLQPAGNMSRLVSWTP
ncbi:MAG: hypothetical protein K9G59_17565 [Caulobacter sp.]|nr:hypothetical protein [Caulobacter sp.]